MTNRFLRSGLFIAMLTGIAIPAHAAVFYTFEFDELTYDGTLFPADSISFELPDLLAFGDIAVIDPPENLNGASIERVSIGGGFAGGWDYTSGTDLSVPIGSVSGFFFAAPGAQAGLGVYPTEDAGRRILLSGGSLFYSYTHGQLTIQEVADSVPEPATLSLVLAGLATTLARRRRARP